VTGGGSGVSRSAQDYPRLEVGSEPAGASALPGDAWRLRGLPAIGGRGSVGVRRAAASRFFDESRALLPDHVTTIPGPVAGRNRRACFHSLTASPSVQAPSCS
jgi:hypothetical protein